jgi:hypothetical protein
MGEALSVAYSRLRFWEKLYEKLLNNFLTAVFSVQGGDGGGHGGGDLLCAQRLADIIPLAWVRRCLSPIAVYRRLLLLKSCMKNY